MSRTPGFRPTFSMWALFVIALLPWNHSSAAVTKAITQYHHDYWTSQFGLPGEAVYQILQSPEGYLWLRTSRGIVRFDGKRFVVVPLRSQGDSSEDVALAMCLGADGNLIARSTDKTFRMRSGTFVERLDPLPPYDPPVREIIETRKGQLWVGTQDSLLMSQNGSLVYVKNYTQWINSFLEDRLGRLWIGSSFALFKYEGQTLTTQMFGKGDTGVETLAEGRDGTLWVGTRRGMYKMSGDTVIPADQIRALAGQHITAILQDRAGNFWIGTHTAGLFRLADGNWSHFSAREGLTDNSVLSLREDSEGSIWVGTKSGLDRFRDTKFLTFTTREGLVSDETSTVTEGLDGSIYVFSAGGGLTRMKDGRTEAYTASNGLGSNYGGALYSSSDGSIWIGTDMGLSRFHEGKLQTYTAEGKLFQRFIAAIAEEQDGSIIGSARRQLFRMRNGQFLPFTIAGQLTPISEGVFTYVLYYDANGTLWVGTERELYKFPKQSAEEAGKTKLRYEKFPILDVKQIFDDKRGSLWLVSKRPGLVRFRPHDGHITEYTTQCGLLANEITRILPDRHNNLWMSSAHGIFMVSRQDLDDYAEGKIKRIQSTAFSTPDGMKTTEASIPQHQPAGWRTRDGRLWFTTRKGLVVVDPEHIPRNNLVPNVLVEEVRVDERLYASNKTIAFSSGHKDLEIHYTALSLSVPDRVRFKYRLEGYDQDWVEAGNRREAYYTHLGTGSYHFRVIASNDDGVWNEAGATWSFSIPPAFYQTNWFILLMWMAVISLIIIAYRMRVQQALSRIQAGFDERMDERTRIAQELHDTVAQTIAGSTMLVETAAEKVPDSLPLVKGALLRAVDQLDVALSQSRAALKGLRSTTGLDNDLEKQLSALTSSIYSKQVEFQMVITGESRRIRPMIQYEVFRIGSEAISNALKHSAATSIRVELGYENGLRLLVRDNGKGIPSEVLEVGKEGHFGLRGMRERADRMSARLVVNSKAGAGTEVCVSVARGVAFETGPAKMTWFGRVVSRLRMLMRRAAPDDSPLV